MCPIHIRPPCIEEKQGNLEIVRSYQCTVSFGFKFIQTTQSGFQIESQIKNSNDCIA